MNQLERPPLGSDNQAESRGESQDEEQVVRQQAVEVEKHLLKAKRERAKGVEAAKTSIDLQNGSIVYLHREENELGSLLLLSSSEDGEHNGPRLSINIQDPKNGSKLLIPPTAGSPKGTHFVEASPGPDNLWEKVKQALNAMQTELAQEKPEQEKPEQEKPEQEKPEDATGTQKDNEILDDIRF